jgi:integrase
MVQNLPKQISETDILEPVSNPQALTTGSPDRKATKIRSKSHLDYWRARIKRPKYSRNGTVHESPHWAVELQFSGRRANWSLGTSNRDAAAGLAKEIYWHLQSKGWQATRERYRPLPEKKTNITLGQYVEAVRALADQSPQTLQSYVVALRKIVADALGIHSPAGTSKYDYRGGGTSAWTQKVDAVRLAKLTPDKIQSWKLSFIARAGTDPLAQRRARNSVNSFLRRAKSLFGPKLTAHLKNTELPNPLPFHGVVFEARQSTKYYSTINIEKLTAAARKELAKKDHEAFKIFLLALCAGLRRHEIDLLEWNSFNWENQSLRIMPTKYFRPKSEDSIGELPLEAEVLAIFLGYYAKAKGSFVIESDIPPRMGVSYFHYRCEPHFERLTEWLRKHGVDGLKPLHTLRKEFGSQLCEQFGIYAASRALRHSSIAISAAFYTDGRARGTVGLGRFLSDKIVPIDPKQSVRRKRSVSAQ